MQEGMDCSEIDRLLFDALDHIRGLDRVPSKREIQLTRADLAAALAAISDLYLAVTDELAAVRGTYR
jgi:hypothetical protein